MIVHLKPSAHTDFMGGRLRRWRTWNPALVWAAIFWVGGALTWTGLALFAGPHHQAFFLVLVLLWAGTVALAVQVIASFRRPSRKRTSTGPRATKAHNRRAARP